MHWLTLWLVYISFSISYTFFKLHTTNHVNVGDPFIGAVVTIHCFLAAFQCLAFDANTLAETSLDKKFKEKRLNL